MTNKSCFMCFVLKKMVIFKKPHIGSVFVRHAAIQNFVEVSNGDNNLNNIFFLLCHHTILY